MKTAVRPLPTSPVSRWIDEVRSTVVQGLGTKGVLALVDQAVVSITGLGTGVLIAHACGDEGLGVYFLALSILIWVRAVQETMISVPYTIYHRRRSPEERPHYAGSALAHHFCLSFLVVVGLLGFAGFFALGGASESLSPLSPVVLALAVAAPWVLLRDFIRHLGFAHLELRSSLAVDSAVGVLQVAGLAALFYVSRHQGLPLLTPQIAFLVIALACGLPCIGWFLCNGNRFRISLGRVWDDWRRNWGFGRWALAGQLAGSTATALFPWLLAHVHGVAFTGDYAASIQLVGLSTMFVTGVMNVLTPRASAAFVTGGVKELRRVLSRTNWLLIGVSGAFTVVVLIVGGSLARLVYGSDFEGTGPVMTVLAASLLVNGIGITYGNGLYAIERPRTNFVADLWLLGFSVVASFALIPILGTLGAALANLIAYTLGMLLRRYLLERRLREREPQTTTID